MWKAKYMALEQYVELLEKRNEAKDILVRSMERLIEEYRAYTADLKDVNESLLRKLEGKHDGPEA